jgi:hypothetical protein
MWVMGKTPQAHALRPLGALPLGDKNYYGVGVGQGMRCYMMLHLDLTQAMHHAIV